MNLYDPRSFYRYLSSIEKKNSGLFHSYKQFTNKKNSSKHEFFFLLTIMRQMERTENDLFKAN